MRTQLTLLSCIAVLTMHLPAADLTRPNVLFIAVDDLNHWVTHLGRNKQVQTPHLDRLARQGITFTRAYCAAPVCNPSRTALLSGLRPSTTGVYDNSIPWAPHVPRGYTLNEHFRAHGYRVCGAGKIYHGGSGRPEDWDDYGRGAGREPAPKGDTGVGGIKFAPLDCPDQDMADYAIATYGIEQLARKHDKPLFLAIGFHKPHMPWNVPRKYFALYPTNQIDLPPYRDDDLEDLPPAGVKMARASGDHEAILASGRWRDAIQGYLAATSFLDTQVGRLLDALDKSAHASNTIVCLWGDHGWHLGEKHHWRKFALWEETTRAPFIWVVPGVTQPGSRCDRPVDFMSIYPTLCDLAGIPIPPHAEGATLRKLLLDSQAQWTTPALTTHGFQNHAIRTAQWRYIRYADGGEELYDHATDEYEWKNLAPQTAEFDRLKAELARFFPKVNQPRPQTPPGNPKANRSRPKRSGRGARQADTSNP